MKIFITGGSKGIGHNIVTTALQQGHDVAFTYCSSGDEIATIEKDLQALNPETMCKAYHLDVSKSQQVADVVDQVLEDFEDIDVVVNNAGITKNNLVFSMSDEEWQEVLDINLNGVFYVIRQFLPIFLGKKKGRFIAISSIAKDGISGQANYSASKAGLIGLCKSVAKEYGPKGITSNIVVPGLFETGLTQKALNKQVEQFWLQHCPLKRMGKLEELSQTVLFLASDASSFINGEVISITGGLGWAG